MSNILYADEVTIDRTITEYRGTLDKIRPEIKKSFELSLTNLGIKLEQSDKLHLLTLPERISLLEELVGAEGDLSTSRPNERHSVVKYILENARGLRIVVPDGLGELSKNPAFSFWFIPGDNQFGPLCLFEGNGSDNDNPFNYGRASTYTLMQSLVYFARKQRNAGVLDLYIPNDRNENNYLKVNETHTEGLVEQYHNVSEFSKDFYEDAGPVVSQRLIK